MAMGTDSMILGRKAVLLGVLGLLCALATGCSSGPRYVAHDINVRLSPEWKASGNVPSLMVDLVVTSRERADQLAGVSVNEYFAPGRNAGLRSGLMQSGEVKSIRFDGSDTADKKISRSDRAVWDKWMEHKTEMYVLVNLLEANEAGKKVAIPLMNDQWRGQKIDLVIQRSGIANESIRQETN